MLKDNFEHSVIQGSLQSKLKILGRNLFYKGKLQSPSIIDILVNPDFP